MKHVGRHVSWAGAALALLLGGCAAGDVNPDEPATDAMARAPGDAGGAGEGEGEGDVQDAAAKDDDPGLAPSPRCGDGVRDADERCDPGVDTTTPCTALDPSYTGGVATCGAGCTWDHSACEAATARCGDGRVDAAQGEQCEPGSFVPFACPAPAFTGGMVRCGATCERDYGGCTAAAATCGNGAREGTEQCDDGNAADGDGCSSRCVREVDTPEGPAEPLRDAPRAPQGPQAGGGTGADGPFGTPWIDIPGNPCRDAATRRAEAARPAAFVGYKLLICRDAAGRVAETLANVRGAMAGAQAHFRAMGIRLSEVAAVELPLPSCVLSSESAVFLRRTVYERLAGVVPIVVVSDFNGPDDRGLWGFGPPGDVVVVKRLARRGDLTTLLAHELGHFFGLMHTHECASGPPTANCDASGDFICDTPIDWGSSAHCGLPAPAGTCSPRCNGGACGGSTPDRSNLMSYYHGCQSRFSAEQGRYARCGLERLPALRRYNRGSSCGNRACEWYESASSCPTDCAAQCLGPERDDPQGGATCGDFALAYTAAAVNVAYYPYVANRDVDVYSAEPACARAEGRGGRVLARLRMGQVFAVQSNRNHACDDRPPLRPASRVPTGERARVTPEAPDPARGAVLLRFGYVASPGDPSRPERAYGWVDAAALSPATTTVCAAGLQYEGFQPRTGATCAPSMCAGPQTCRAAGGAPDDEPCGGSRVPAGEVVLGTVNRDVAPVYYAPGVAIKRHLHRGDRVRVLYRGAGARWLFVHATEQAPDGQGGLACPGLSHGYGWVQALDLDLPR